MQQHLLDSPLVSNPQAGCSNMADVDKVCLMKIPIIFSSTLNYLSLCEE